MTKTILIVDDHTLFASAMQFLLHALDPNILTRTAPTVSTALRLMETSHFDLVLLDYSMPGTEGFAAFNTIRAARPGVPVAFLSGLTDGRVVMRALDLGAAGWLPKSIAGEPLLHALNLILSGERFVPAELMLASPPIALSPRELDVAELLAEGMADKEIAKQLDLQPNTVKVHVKALLNKYGTDNRTRFALAFRRGGA